MRRSASVPIVVVTALLCALIAVAPALPTVRAPAPAGGVPATAVSAAQAPPAPPPPTLLSGLSNDQARAVNAAMPFAAGPVPPAPPFHYRGAPADRAAAEACLTAALLYEAGDDPPGQEAVAQLVVNRLRHPSYPKTVCGVIFQGSERATGCQFTFTCDGSLARDQNPAAWVRARRIARAALDGHVDKTVGTVTHDHTDWVVPYWRDSLVKVAQVHTQIYYRFPGRWGRPDALTGAPSGPERPDPRLIRFAPELALPASDSGDLEPADATIPRQTLAIAGVPSASLKHAIVRLKNEEAAQYVLQLDAGDAGGWGMAGYTICGAKEDCLVLGWTSEPETPRTLPVLPPAMATLAFMYRKSSVLGEAQARWDCSRFPRPLKSQCLPR